MEVNNSHYERDTKAVRKDRIKKKRELEVNSYSHQGAFLPQVKLKSLLLSMNQKSSSNFRQIVGYGKAALVFQQG